MLSQHPLQWEGAWSRGVCSLGGVVMRVLLQGESAPRGCLVETPPTATAAAGTHPPGMHPPYIFTCTVISFREFREFYSSDDVHLRMIESHLAP